MIGFEKFQTEISFVLKNESKNNIFFMVFMSQ